MGRKMGWPETDHPIKYFVTANKSDTGVVVYETTISPLAKA